MQTKCSRVLVRMAFTVSLFLFLSFFLLKTKAIPHSSEIKEQNLSSNTTIPPTSLDIKTEESEVTNNTLDDNIVTTEKEEKLTTSKAVAVTTELEARPIIKIKTTVLNQIFETLSNPIVKFYQNRRVKYVLKNVGICMVNGVMELVTYFLPAPMIPLVTSLAGMMIPFEPVILLREKIPVTSYRRALNSAMDSFLGTFDGYKRKDDFDLPDDPYMAKKFNRRFGKD